MCPRTAVVSVPDLRGVGKLTLRQHSSPSPLNIFIPILPIYRLVCPYRRGVKVKKTADRNSRVHARQGPAASHFIFSRDALTPHGHLWRSPCGRRGVGCLSLKPLEILPGKKRQSIKNQTAASRDSACKSVAVSQIAYFH